MADPFYRIVYQIHRHNNILVHESTGTSVQYLYTVYVRISPSRVTRSVQLTAMTRRFSINFVLLAPFVRYVNELRRAEIRSNDLFRCITSFAVSRHALRRLLKHRDQQNLRTYKSA